MEYIEIIMLLGILYLLLSQRQTTYRRSLANAVIVDSCGLIDGRILTLARSRLLDSTIIVPRFIINELQLLADGKDGYKRERARHGLDVLHKLKELLADKLLLPDDDYAADMKTDEKLLALARKKGGRIYTTDSALIKMAAVDNIITLNVNEIALALRPEVLPGESIEVLLQQKGSSRDQAIGYTDDGSMVVVDNATRFIGKKVKVVCQKIHQTVAGKMLFAALPSTPAKTEKQANSAASRFKKSAGL